MKTQESAWKDEEILDTKALQLFALKEFMFSLNYQYVGGSILGNPHFYSNHHSNKGRESVSFSSAVNLFNGNTVKCVFGRPPHKLCIWSFNDYTLTKAKASRILLSVKLQLCKKTKTILCQDHRVKFVLPSYKALFLGNKYL